MKACEFGSLLHQCAQEVLDSMYFTTVLGVAPLESASDGWSRIAQPIAFSLEFAGDISGHFGLQVTKATARTLAANFLGEEETNISSRDVNEVVSELANMLCGSVMSRVEREHPFVLSHPATHSFPLPNVEDFLACAIETDSGGVMVWLQVEGNQCLS